MEENGITEQAKSARREYYRKWRAKNKDRIKASNERYWMKRAMKILAEKEAENESK